MLLQAVTGWSAFGANPTTVDLLSGDSIRYWQLSSMWRWDSKPYSLTGETNWALHAANREQADALASVLVGPLDHHWKITARFELLRQIPFGGRVGITQLRLGEANDSFVVAEVQWMPTFSRFRFSIHFRDGGLWSILYRDPIDAFTELGGTAVAWEELEYDPLSRRLTLRFAPVGGESRSVSSEPLPQDFIGRLSRVGISCMSSEQYVHDLLMTSDPRAESPEPPRLFHRRLSNGQTLVFWNAQAGRHYGVLGSRDFSTWTDEASVIGGNAGELVEVEIPQASIGTKILRLEVR
ncbi:MAG: hypothetical protein JNK85_12740 [Verrucomicrobiales bacterium]|nr:hypothetical protein [Verrucomicrobiales bacterium]